MVYIYTLQLEQGKYYVGKTNNPQFRLESHFNSNGSEWTKIYKPIRLMELKPNCDDYDEDKITKQYMDKYGIQNVRGGSFVSVNLSNDTINVLNTMNKGTNNKCFKCGEIGHFIKNCTQNTNTNTNTNTPTTITHINNNTNSFQYNICNNGPKCKGCNDWDRCQSNKVEILYVDDNKVFYNKNGEIYEKCKGKYNCIYHNTGKFYKIPNKKNEQCNCPTSYFSPHRKINCILKDIV